MPKMKLSHLSKCSMKNIITLLVITVFFYIFLHFCVTDIPRFVENLSSIATFVDRLEESPRPKYILTWNKYYLFTNKKGHSIFPSLNCSISNCIFTHKRDLLKDYTKFDAIVFNHDHLITKEGRPTRRSNSQIYIFTTIESSANVPACEVYNDDFFNWTLTYRLDSDIVWNYFVVRNLYQNIVAPSKDVKWVETKDFTSPKIRAIFQGRRKAAAWIVSNCNAASLRDDYLSRLQEHLFHYSLQIDVYGGCTNIRCENGDCGEMLRNNYYFYMAFENSFAEDYVTEKVLHGYDNYVVPIVFGTANYSRFLPPDSYINAREYHPYNLADIMFSAMNDPTSYDSYFKWTNYYTIDSDLKTNHPLCELCKALNSDKAGYAPAKKHFRVWWNSLKGMKWCLPGEYWNETLKVNLDGKHIHGY